MEVKFQNGSDWVAATANLKIDDRGAVEIPIIGEVYGGWKTSGSQSFKFKLVADAPSPKVAIPASLETCPVYFEKIDKDQPSTTALRKLREWTNKIKDIEPLHAVIKEGKVKLTLTGHASKSGSTSYNKKLTERRIASVSKVLKSSAFLNSSKLGLASVPKGKADAFKGKDAEHDLRVDVTFKKADALSLIGG